MKSIWTVFGNKSRKQWVRISVMGLAFLVACILPIQPTVLWQEIVFSCGFTIAYMWYLNQKEDHGFNITDLSTHTVRILRGLLFVIYVLLCMLVVFCNVSAVGLSPFMTWFILFIVGISTGACTAVVLSTPNLVFKKRTENSTTRRKS